MITESSIYKALSTVMDPDLGKDLVSLGMVKEIQIQNQHIVVEIELTTPACPLKEKIKQDCITAIQGEVGTDVSLDIKMSANVTSSRSEKIDILPSVKNIICVASGKGGVGKSTVSTNLAAALSKQGAKVGLMDADIHGPSLTQMLGIQGVKPELRKIKEKYYILPIERNGLKIISIGALVDAKQAVVWRGPMVTSVLKQFATDVIWGKLDYLIIDMPPGTGDVHLTIVQTLSVTGAVIVTTPQEVALADSRKAISMFTLPQMNIPIIGVVENMSYFSPPELPKKKYYLFGKDGGKKLADEYDLPFLGAIPITEHVHVSSDTGNPVVWDENDTFTKENYEAVAQNVARNTSRINAKKKEISEKVALQENEK